MCGISGIIFRQCVSVDEAQKIGNTLLKSQDHRGPNGNGMIFVDENLNVFPVRTSKSPIESNFEIPYLNFININEISSSVKIILCHNRLSVIDLSLSGHQPMSNKEKTLWITYNGEIYNHPELREKYFKNHTFYSRTDTEVLLKIIEQKGINGLDELNGMWAFGCLNLNQKDLLLCRDRLGVKPIYYFFSPQYFIFSSEVKTLLATGLIMAEIDLTRLPYYLYYGQCDFREKTFFKNIRPVPAGSWLNFDIDKHQIKKINHYFQINFEEKKIENPEDLILQTLDLSVYRHLRSDIPLGISLSGGIDSITILSFASEKQENPVPCFSAIMTGFEKDESEIIKKIVHQFKAELHTVNPTGEDFFQRLDELQTALDFPIFDGSTFAQFLVMEKASLHGIRVILGGQGSDEWNAGYLHHIYLHHFNNFLSGLFIYWMDFVKNPSRIISEYLHVFHPRWVFYSKKRKRFNFIQEDIFRNDEFIESLEPDLNLNDSLQKDLTERRLPGFLRCEDRTSMWFGVESRPLFSDDWEWIQLALAIKSDLKVNRKKGKFILRKSLKGRIPSEILDNKNKIAFSVPTFNWFKKKEKEVLSFIYENSQIITKNNFPKKIMEKNFIYISRIFFYEKWKKKLSCFC